MKHIEQKEMHVNTINNTHAHAQAHTHLMTLCLGLPGEPVPER